MIDREETLWRLGIFENYLECTYNDSSLSEEQQNTAYQDAKVVRNYMALVDDYIITEEQQGNEHDN